MTCLFSKLKLLEHCIALHCSVICPLRKYQMLNIGDPPPPLTLIVSEASELSEVLPGRWTQSHWGQDILGPESERRTLVTRMDTSTALVTPIFSRASMPGVSNLIRLLGY